MCGAEHKDSQNRKKENQRSVSFDCQKEVMSVCVEKCRSPNIANLLQCNASLSPREQSLTYDLSLKVHARSHLGFKFQFVIARGPVAFPIHGATFG